MPIFAAKFYYTYQYDIESQNLPVRLRGYHRHLRHYRPPTSIPDVLPEYSQHGRRRELYIRI